jgi:hypothetical protein
MNHGGTWHGNLRLSGNATSYPPCDLCYVLDGDVERGVRLEERNEKIGTRDLEYVGCNLCCGIQRSVGQNVLMLTLISNQIGT